MEAAKQQLILEQDRRNDELAGKRREDQAAGLADMHVVIRDHPQEPRIKVENNGPHEASEVMLTYLDADDGLPPPYTREWHRLATTLAAGEHGSVIAGFAANSTKLFRVTLRWKDAAGSQSKVVQLQRE